MKLLDKTVRVLLGYAIVVLLISIPVFYLLIEKLYFEDVDDALIYKKMELENRTKRLHNDQQIELWLAMDGEVSLAPFKGIQKDTIYPKVYLDTLDNEMEPYRELRTAIKINGVQYTMTIRRSLVESQDLITGIAQAQALLLVFLFGGWIFINRRISNSIWSPFHQIIAKLQNYEMGKKPESQVSATGINEFDLLNQVVTELMDKNHLLFINQRNFIENASHEMQTPVAILQSKLDLLLCSEGLTEQQSRYLQSFYQAIERLNHLNKSLLLLSQIENQQFTQTVEVSLSSVIHKILEHVDEVIEEKQLKINLSIGQDKVLMANQVLIEILISNLLTNALHHIPQDGSIDIFLDEYTLVIKNSGLPLSFETEKLFTRFPKRSGTRYGVGLGLAIVKEICELFNLSVEYQYDDQHCFIIRF
jgi:signal transduction histidine kinase